MNNWQEKAVLISNGDAVQNLYRLTHGGGDFFLQIAIFYAENTGYLGDTAFIHPTPENMCDAFGFGDPDYPSDPIETYGFSKEMTPLDMIEHIVRHHAVGWGEFLHHALPSIMLWPVGTTTGLNWKRKQKIMQALREALTKTNEAGISH